MKIAIIGANGKAGKKLTEEALKRGHEVLAVVRSKKPDMPKTNVLIKDLFDLTYDDVKEYDVIIDAFGAYEPALLPLHQTSLLHIADMLSGKPNRLLVVGSAGGLYVDKEHKMRLLDSPSMPEIFKPLSTSMTAAFDELKVRDDVNWTYMSPPAVFDAEGERTGKYQSGDDELLVNAKGDSYISYADGAIALIDEAERGRHIKKRFTIVSK